MATNTYVALQTQTLSSPAASVTFSSIPQGYTDFIVVANFGISNDGYILGYRINSDTGTNYSWTYLRGNGSSASSSRKSGMTLGSVADEFKNDNFNTAIINFQNYSNTTTNKTVIARTGNAGKSSAATVSLWRSTAAITSITLAESGDGGTGTFGTGNLTAGSTFTIYGIANSNNFALATGGTLYETSSYWYHVFGANGTFTPKQALTADILVVAGGGGSSGNWGGGGGAGGLLSFTSQSLASGTAYTCTVGAGGAGAQYTPTNGGNSVFGALTTAVGGGSGGNAGSNSGGTGGSGGGGTYDTGVGNGTAGQGNAGGAGQLGGGGNARGGGGGGAGASGGAANGSIAGVGGIGVYSTFTDQIGAVTGLGDYEASHYYFAGGGGGGGANGGTDNSNVGGYGGGGNGSRTAPTSGQANTGGGGGGGAGNVLPVAGNGGSGLVIVRYAK